MFLTLVLLFSQSPSAEQLQDSIISPPAWTEIVHWEDTIVLHRSGDDPMVRFSLDDGDTYSDPIPFDWTIHLDVGSFDPLVEELDLPAELLAGPDCKLFLIQFQGPLLEPWRLELEETGWTSVAMLSSAAHVMRLKEGNPAWTELPFVRWASPFHPAFGMSTDSLDDFRKGDAPTDLELEVEILPQNMLLGGHSSSSSLAPGKEMSGVKAKTVLGGEYVNAQGFTGQAGPNSTERVAGLVIDGANKQGNPNILGRSFYGLDGPWVDGGPDPSFHGAKTFSCVFADGTQHPVSEAALMGGEGYWIPLNVWNGLQIPVADFFRRIQDDNIGTIPTIKGCFWTSSSSLLLGIYGDYNQDSHDIDEAYFTENPFPGDDRGVSCVYMSHNVGDPDTPKMAAIAWAKNVITVGGLRNDTDDLLLTDDYWWGVAGETTSESGRGPTPSGRVKPDVVSYNSGIGSSQPRFLGTGWIPAHHAGTSAATPNVAGHVGLLYQLWGEGVFSNPITGTTYFDSRPPASTIKALLIHSTVSYVNNPNGPTNDATPNSISRDRQGWGVPNLEHLFRRRFNFVYRDESHQLQLGERHTFYVQTSTLPIAGTPDEFRATMVYTDYPGVVGAANDLQFDFNMRLVDESGNVYWGNYGLVDRDDGMGGTIYATNASTPVAAGNPKRDNANNVENIWIPNLPGDSKLRVDIFCDQMPVNPNIAGFSMALSPCAELTVATNSIQLTGPNSVAVGSSPTFTFSGAPANASYWVNSSSFDAGYWIGDHPFDLGPTVTVEDSGTTSPTGTGSWTLPNVPASMSGATFFLEVGVKQSGTWFDSNMHTVSVL